MEDLIKNLKKKLSVDNLMGMMKEAKVIDNTTGIKEEDVRKTLEKVDPNNLVDAEDLAKQLTDMAEQNKIDASSPKTSPKTKSSFSVLSKTDKSKPENTESIDDSEEVTVLRDDPSFLD